MIKRPFHHHGLVMSVLNTTITTKVLYVEDLSLEVDMYVMRDAETSDRNTPLTLVTTHCATEMTLKLVIFKVNKLHNAA